MDMFFDRSTRSVLSLLILLILSILSGTRTRTRTRTYTFKMAPEHAIGQLISLCSLPVYSQEHKRCLPRSTFFHAFIAFICEWSLLLLLLFVPLFFALSFSLFLFLSLSLTLTHTLYLLIQPLIHRPILSLLFSSQWPTLSSKQRAQFVHRHSQTHFKTPILLFSASLFLSFSLSSSIQSFFLHNSPRSTLSSHSHPPINAPTLSLSLTRLTFTWYCLHTSPLALPHTPALLGDHHRSKY